MVRFWTAEQPAAALVFWTEEQNSPSSWTKKEQPLFLFQEFKEGFVSKKKRKGLLVSRTARWRSKKRKEKKWCCSLSLKENKWCCSLSLKEKKRNGVVRCRSKKRKEKKRKEDQVLFQKTRCLCLSKKKNRCSFLLFKKKKKNRCCSTRNQESCAVVPLCRCAVVPLCRCAVVPLCRCAVVSCWTKKKNRTALLFLKQALCFFFLLKQNLVFLLCVSETKPC